MLEHREGFGSTLAVDKQHRGNRYSPEDIDR
jgi:hypothetical protein